MTAQDNPPPEQDPCAADPEVGQLLLKIIDRQEQQQHLIEKTTEKVGCLYDWLILNLVLAFLGFFVWLFAFAMAGG